VSSSAVAKKAETLGNLILQESVIDGTSIFFQVDPQGNAALRKVKGIEVRDPQGQRFETFFFEDGWELHLPSVNSAAPIGLVPSRDVQ
jgi:hypothetical protein